MGFCGGSNDDDRIPLWCPWCGKRHVDEGEFATRRHHTHRCVKDAAGAGCGREWRLEQYIFGAVPDGPLVVNAAERFGFELGRKVAALFCRRQADMLLNHGLIDESRAVRYCQFHIEKLNAPELHEAAPKDPT